MSHRKHIRRDMIVLAILGSIASVSGVMFYYMQYHLTMTLWDSFKQMEQSAADWRSAFISKRDWY